MHSASLEENLKTIKIIAVIPENKALYIDGKEQVVSNDGLYTVSCGSHELAVGEISSDSVIINFDINCDDADVIVPNSSSTKPYALNGASEH